MWNSDTEKVSEFGTFSPSLDHVIFNKTLNNPKMVQTSQKCLKTEHPELWISDAGFWIFTVQ